MNLNIKYKTEFDFERDSEVSRADMDINMTISQQRLIINVLTVSNVIKVYQQLMEVFAEKTPQQLKIQIENKKYMIQFLTSKHD